MAKPNDNNQTGDFSTDGKNQAMLGPDGPVFNAPKVKPIGYCKGSPTAFEPGDTRWTSAQSRGLGANSADKSGQDVKEAFEAAKHAVINRPSYRGGKNC